MNFNTSDFTLTPSADDSNLVLCDRIARQIADSPQQRITFAEYMELVLYQPEQGYYATNVVNIGTQGDFFTSPHLGADFGELLAEQFVQMWEILGKPTSFSLIEMGAGQGILALDILKYLQQHYPDFFASLNYIIVEKSPALREEQRQRLQEFSLRWCNLEEIPSNSITGCFFSNELVDALPVHQFIIEEGQLQEIYVTTLIEAGEQEDKGDKEASYLPPTTYRLPSSPSNLAPFVEVVGEPSTPRLAEYFDLVTVELPSKAYADGYRSEINLAALDWLRMVAERLQHGYVLTIDYGYPASRYYSPRRSQGTLQCYYQHHRHDNPYINIGRQDITAHVEFTALERWGDHCGLQKVGFIQQGLFLMALGIGDRIAGLSTTNQSIQQVLLRRDTLHQLIDPIGLGGFGVLVQSKGLTEAETAQPLKGLNLPSI